MAYNGCIIDGTVRNSILFPGVHVMAGAEINDSILFFDNIVHPGVRLNRVVSDVNTVFNRDVRVGAPRVRKTESGKRDRLEQQCAGGLSYRLRLQGGPADRPGKMAEDPS